MTTPSLRPGKARTSALAGILVLVTLVAMHAAPAEGGVQNIPCRRPFVFRNASVNVVVLPYLAPKELTTDATLGTHLAGLVQLEVLRSIAKFGSVGAVQMVGPADECDPDLVVAKLLGSAPGAETTLGKGQGLVLVWGRFFSRDGTLFVQTYCRFLRAGVAETVDLVAAGQHFSGQLSAQAFACAPRRVTIEDLKGFEQQFRRSTILRAEPREDASGTPMPPEPLPYWISDTRGDWMRIASQRGLGGWIRLGSARDAWSLARWLPELLYVEGIVGYLRFRAAGQQARGALPNETKPADASGSRVAAQSWGPARSAWAESASRALAEYERAIALPSGTADNPALPWRTALAGAVQLQMRGVMAAANPDGTSTARAGALDLLVARSGGHPPRWRREQPRGHREAAPGLRTRRFRPGAEAGRRRPAARDRHRSRQPPPAREPAKHLPGAAGADGVRPRVPERGRA